MGRKWLVVSLGSDIFSFGPPLPKLSSSLSGSLKPLRPTDLERVFEQHRQEVERIAAEKILAGLQGDGPVLVRVVDLSP